MIFGNSVLMAEKSLSYLWKKQELTLDNIANVETPGYKKKHISFEETFRDKLAAADLAKDSDTMETAIKSSQYSIWERDDSSRIDENNVNLDVETTELTRTALHYQYMLQSVNADITRLRAAIKGQ